MNTHTHSSACCVHSWPTLHLMVALVSWSDTSHATRQPLQAVYSDVYLVPNKNLQLADLLMLLLSLKRFSFNWSIVCVGVPRTYVNGPRFPFSSWSGIFLRFGTFFNEPRSGICCEVGPAARHLVWASSYSRNVRLRKGRKWATWLPESKPRIQGSSSAQTINYEMGNNIHSLTRSLI